MALINSDWLSWCDGWNKATEQTQCKTSVTHLCLSHCVCACFFNPASVFVYLIALKVCLHPDLPHHPSECVYMGVCVFTHDEHVVPAEEKAARSRTMCHNYVQGVTVKTALKPDEVLFTNINIQIELSVSLTKLSVHIPCGHDAFP